MSVATSSKSIFRKKKSPKQFEGSADYTYQFQNELGSVMEFNYDSSSGQITGTYQSAVGDTTVYPLIGFGSGNIVTFTVSYTAEGSIAAWAGQAVWDESTSLWTIPTLWNLVVPTDPADEWEDTYAGADTFTQIA